MRSATTSSRTSRTFSDPEIKRIANSTSIGIAKWVRATAEERNISVRRRMPLHEFARAISRLSDAEIDLDQVEELLDLESSLHSSAVYFRLITSAKWSLRSLIRLGITRRRGISAISTKKKTSPLSVIWKLQRSKTKSTKSLVSCEGYQESITSILPKHTENSLTRFTRGPDRIDRRTRAT